MSWARPCHSFKSKQSQLYLYWYSSCIFQKHRCFRSWRPASSVRNSIFPRGKAHGNCLAFVVEGTKKSTIHSARTGSTWNRLRRVTVYYCVLRPLKCSGRHDMPGSESNMKQGIDIRVGALYFINAATRFPTHSTSGAPAETVKVSSPSAIHNSTSSTWHSRISRAGVHLGTNERAETLQTM